MMKRLSWILGLTLLSAALVAGCSQDSSSKPSTPQTTAENPGTEAETPANNSNIENSIEEAIKAAEAYKLKEYTISEVPETPLAEEILSKRNEEMEPFFAQSFQEKPVHLSHVSLVLRVAESQQALTRPENMEFEVSQEAENYVDLDYTMDFLLEKENGDSERIPLKGVLTLVNKNEKWLVQADNFDKLAFKDLVPENVIPKE
ncbi:hypothetical protein [Paenibacillus massiliensis]|uniref:hypothetical protein n=1 Tax=Paenibacillus massiliensis TaxID=225917 RepID=UPI00048F064A|nr:hypothetical protein [Paenibacillus massiliensis]